MMEDFWFASIKIPKKKLFVAGAMNSNWHLRPFAEVIAVLFNAVF